LRVGGGAGVNKGYFSRRLKLALALAGPSTFAVMLATSEAASAEGTCPNPGPGSRAGYYYSQQSMNPSWQGLEGFMTVENSFSLFPNNSHLLNLFDLQSTPSLCVDPTGFSSQCWLQVGYGSGTLSLPCGETDPVGIYAYEENESVGGGYNCTWLYPIALSPDDFFTTYYSGINDGSGDGLIDADINTGTGPVLIGQAWVPTSDMFLVAGTEAYVATTEQCPSENADQYFGTTPGGAASSSYGLYKSLNGSTWDSWTIAPTHAGGTPGYYDYQRQANYYSFKTWDPNG